MSVTQLWTRAQLEEQVRLVYGGAADLFMQILDGIPDAKFRDVDRQMLAETADVIVSINLSKAAVSVGMAPAGTVVPAGLFQGDTRAPATKGAEIVPFTARGETES
jgi:hypothetical protein